ncbi:hypothetical protein ACFY7C_19330 [Streptomyces sp. NPDC012769]|uniref:hypothetical protein n=1 Tax=Streptomyces sp. NPDC012769 TaxID=3364848 RepID=UPI0036C9477F
MYEPVVDARGVEIEPGDTVIYGYTVGRSVALAEAVVVGEEGHRDIGPIGFNEFQQQDSHGCSCGNNWPCFETDTPVKSSVSLTPTGRVRLRIVRRSYGSWHTKPVVDVAPDRLIVLKPIATDVIPGRVMLPPSPLQERER